MNETGVIELVREGIWVGGLIAGPTLVVVLIVGVVVGIFQAATSINEMTLSFIPKVVCLSMALLLFGGWMLGTLVEFTRGIFQRIPALFG